MVDTNHKQPFAGRTSLQAMEDRQFEWAVIENVVSDAATEQCFKDPENWNLLHPDFVENMVDFTDAHLDWFLQRFMVFLMDMLSGFGQCFECHT